MVMENNLAAPRAKLTKNEDENEEDFLFYKGKGEYGRREEDDDDDNDEEEDGEYEEEREGDAEEESKGGEGVLAKSNLMENSVPNGSKTVQGEKGGSVPITYDIGGTSSRNYPSLSVSEKSNSYSESSGSYPAFSVSEKDFGIQDEDDNFPAPPLNFLVDDSKFLKSEKDKNASTTTGKANGPSLSNAISFRSPENVKGIDFDDDYDDTSDFNNKSLVEKASILENEKTDKDEKKEEKSEEEEKTKKGEGIGQVGPEIFEKTEKNEKTEKEEKNVKATLTQSISLRVRPVESVEGVRFDDEIIEEEDEGEGEEEEETTGDKGSKKTEYLEQTGARGVYQDGLESDVTRLAFPRSSQTELEEGGNLNDGKNGDVTNLELGIREQSSLYEQGLRVRQSSAEIADVEEFGNISTNGKDVDIANAKESQISETKNIFSTNEPSIQPKTTLEVPPSENSHKVVSEVILQEQSSISQSVTVPKSHEKDNMTEVREIPVPVPVSDSDSVPVPVPAPAPVSVSVTAPVLIPVAVPAPVAVPTPVSVPAPVSVSKEAVDLSPSAKPDSSISIATEKPIQGDLKSTLIPATSKGGKQEITDEDDDENYGVKQKGFRRILGHFVCGCQHRNF